MDLPDGYFCLHLFLSRTTLNMKFTRINRIVTYNLQKFLKTFPNYGDNVSSVCIKPLVKRRYKVCCCSAEDTVFGPHSELKKNVCTCVCLSVLENSELTHSRLISNSGLTFQLV